MILFVGDVHNKIGTLERIVRAHPEAGAVIQVGDLVPHAPGIGIPDAWWRPMRLPIRFVDGNHHDYARTRNLRAPTELLPGLIYCPRGTVEEIDGRRVAFLGGAESHTPEWRAQGVDYWPEEEGIRDADLDPLLRLARGDVDILVSHTPPACVEEAITRRPASPSACRVERAWRHLGEPEVICGHHDHGYDDGVVQVLRLLGHTVR